MIKINIVDLEKLYNFVVKYFLIWIRLGLQYSIWNFLCRVFYFWHSANNIFSECQRKTLGKEFSNLRNSIVVFAWQDDFKTKSYQLQSFITWDLQSLFREFFQPRLFKKSNFKIFQIKTRFCMTRWTQIKKLPNTKFHNFSWSTEFILVILSYVHLTWWF